MFDDLIDEIFEVEGKYSNHPSDTGGETMYGITKNVAVKYGYQGEMKNMPKTLAKQIYRERYWLPLNLDMVCKICPVIVRELLDTGINQGVGRAAEYLQLSLNALNRQEKDFSDLAIDGDIGAHTLSALQKFVHLRKNDGELVLLKALNCLQGAFYINLSQSRKKDEDFVFGWLKNRVML